MALNRLRERGNIYQVAVLAIALSLAVVLLMGCESREQPPEEGEMALSVSSSVFQEGGAIPLRYSCQGQNVSPPLAWSEPPSGTQSLALIVDDPDAPVEVFTHWVIFNIPADSRGLPEAVPTRAELPSGAFQGKNDFGRMGYGGPCPPPGRPHQYQFTVYALDQPLDLKAGVSKKQVLDAMWGHVLAKGQLTGRYQR